MRVETIGNATLYLGDCRTVLPKLGKVDCIITDPPYGMAFRSNHRNERYESIANDESSDLLRWACNLMPPHSLYVFCRWDNIAEIRRPKSVITWIKNNWSMGDLEHEHARQTETCAFWPGPDHAFPSGRPSDVVYAARTTNQLHPTEKPVGLMEQVVGWTVGTILDPFMGSGTTGVACARLGRRFIGVELEPKYFDIARRRIEEAQRQADLFIKPVEEDRAYPAHQLDLLP